jgi:hypothetical protein
MPSILAQYDEENYVLEVTIVDYYITNDILRQIKNVLLNKFSIESKFVGLKDKKNN